MSSPDSTMPLEHSDLLLRQAPALHGRILIALNETQDAERSRAILTQLGGEVRVAQNGRAILDAVALEPPELLLLDANLPDTDCVEIIHQLKAADATRFLPIVILTGQDVEPETCLEAGADDFLRRPVSRAELVMRVRLLLRLGRLHQDLTDNNSELQAAYEIARESEAKYRALIQDAQDALVLIDADTGTILEANQCARDLSGYQEDDLIGQPITMICADGPQGRWPEMLAHVTSVGRTGVGEGALLCKDGSTVPVETQAGLANHHLGKPLVQLLMRDLRPRRQLDMARTQAERLAAVVETAVTVNHEINNPLLVITSSVDMLQRSLFEADSGVREKLERINEACQRIQRFTQQLTSVIAPVSKEYLPGMKMLDLRQSVAAEADSIAAS